MSVRRLWVLVNGLPPDAATFRDPDGWTWERELAAAQIEITDRWGRIVAQAAQGMKFRQLPDPVRIPRPGEPEPQHKQVETDPRAIAAWFAKHVG